MGIYIRGMEMPKSCSRCFCMASCKLWKNIMSPEFNRHRNCPLVPVPPHGRLGDLDELKAKVKKEDSGYELNSFGDGMWTAFQSVYRCIDAAPTVITEEGNLQSDSVNTNNSEVIANTNAEGASDGMAHLAQY